MCTGIDFLRSVLDPDLLWEKGSALGAAEFCRAPASHVFYTPAFRKAGSCCEVMQGIDAMVQAMAARASRWLQKKNGMIFVMPFSGYHKSGYGHFF